MLLHIFIRQPLLKSLNHPSVFKWAEQPQTGCIPNTQACFQDSACPMWWEWNHISKTGYFLQQKMKGRWLKIINTKQLPLTRVYSSQHLWTVHCLAWFYLQTGVLYVNFSLLEVLAAGVTEEQVPRARAQAGNPYLPEENKLWLAWLLPLGLACNSGSCFLKRWWLSLPAYFRFSSSCKPGCRAKRSIIEMLGQAEECYSCAE